jgi:hypothetical protein
MEQVVIGFFLALSECGHVGQLYKAKELVVDLDVEL